jgi:g-D-glutamyl-meso-diaminopimelate peptidase
MAKIMGVSSGYAVAQPTGLASHGGFKDWFIQTTGRAGFTWECGKGENPLPQEDLEPIYARIREMMALTTLM